MTDLSLYYRNILLRTTDLHAQFSGKRVFVVGSTGFYGAWFLGFFNYLREQGCDVAVSGRSLRSSGLDVLNLRTYSPDLLNADYVINCAGDAGGGDLAVHVWGPLCLVAVMDGHTTLLQFSSGAVSAESSTAYAIAKARSEARLSTAHCAVQIVRPFATVGPRMNLDSHFAIPTFLRQTLARQSLEVAPDVSRSFCHIVDLVVQCLHAMVSGDGTPYDVGSDDLITMEQAALLISQNVTVVKRDYPTTSAAASYAANLKRVNSQFNLSLDYTSTQAVMDTARFYGVAPR